MKVIKPKFGGNPVIKSLFGGHLGNLPKKLYYNVATSHIMICHSSIVQI